MTTCIYCGKEIPILKPTDSRRKFCPDGCYKAYLSAQKIAENIERRGGKHWTDPDECPQCHEEFMRNSPQQKVCTKCHNFNHVHKLKVDGTPFKNSHVHRDRAPKIKYLKPGEGPSINYTPLNRRVDKQDFDKSRFHDCVVCKRPFYGDGEKCPTCRGIYPVIKTTYNHTERRS
jgi:hypothetical protein